MTISVTWVSGIYKCYRIDYISVTGLVLSLRLFHLIRITFLR